MWRQLFLPLVLLSPLQAEDTVVSICKVFDNLPAWNNRRIAVRGISYKTDEGTWLSGDCSQRDNANGPGIGPHISLELPDGYTRENPGKLPTLSPVPRNAAQFQGRHTVRTIQTWVGRLTVDESYHYECRANGEYFPAGGYGHLNGSAAKLTLEEIRDVELEKEPPEVEQRDVKPCFSARVAHRALLRQIRYNEPQPGDARIE